MAFKTLTFHTGSAPLPTKKFHMYFHQNIIYKTYHLTTSTLNSYQAFQNIW